MNKYTSTEAMIQELGCTTAPRITPSDIDNLIKDTDFYVFPNTLLTVCCLTLQNGFNVTGESACASPANFNPQVGEKVAFDNAKQKIWQLAGYLLKEELFRKGN